MAQVADYTVIRKTPLSIGDGAPARDREEREISFQMERNFIANQQCLLQYEIKGLTVANEDPVVEINNAAVGNIIRCDVTGRDNDYIADRIWFQQTIVIDPNRIKAGRNTLEIKSPSWSGAKSGNLYDDFQIRNMVLMYKTDSDR